MTSSRASALQPRELADCLAHPHGWQGRTAREQTQGRSLPYDCSAPVNRKQRQWVAPTIVGAAQQHEDS